ncbi:MAG: hypothetical protein H7A00_01880 [Hahellaceae bacterium]|nr:hypothetical protein [Hahellaceae bacterium]
MKSLKLVWVFALYLATLAQVARAGDVNVNVDKVKEVVGQNFQEIMAEGVPFAEEKILANEHVAFAVMILVDGRIKKVNFKESSQAPVAATVGLLQRSLYALAKKNEIGASGIFYTAPDPKDASKMILVTELEHIYGVAVLRATGYTQEGNKLVFGSPIDVNKDFKVFHYTDPADKGKH